MFIFFIVVWIIAIFCIFKNFEVNNVKPEDDPVDDPEYSKAELNLRDIINNQVLDDEFNKIDLENKKIN